MNDKNLGFRLGVLAMGVTAIIVAVRTIPADPVDAEDARSQTAVYSWLIREGDRYPGHAPESFDAQQVEAYERGWHAAMGRVQQAIMDGEI